MGEVSRRSGRPVTFGLAQSDRRPELFRRVVGFAKEENSLGGCVRPQTTARGVGVLFGLQSRTPFDGSPAWPSSAATRCRSLLALRDAATRTQLIAEAEDHPPRLDLRELYVLPPGPARYDCDPDSSLAAHAERRGCPRPRPSSSWCWRPTALSCALLPLNHPRGGRGDAGRSAGDARPRRCRRPRRPDHGRQPADLLPHVLDPGEGRWALEEAIRRLTSDTAELFGIVDRGVLRPGAFADVNVIDLDDLTLHQPEFVHAPAAPSATCRAAPATTTRWSTDRSSWTTAAHRRRWPVAPLDGLSRPLRSPGRSSGGRQGSVP